MESTPANGETSIVSPSPTLKPRNQRGHYKLKLSEESTIIFTLPLFIAFCSGLLTLGGLFYGLQAGNEKIDELSRQIDAMTLKQQEVEVVKGIVQTKIEYIEKLSLSKKTENGPK